MKTKGLIGLVATAAAAVVIAVLVSAWGGTAALDPRQGEAVLPGLGPHLAEVARVTIVHGNSTTTLLRQGKDWVVEEKSSYPADTAKLGQALLGLAELTYVEPKTKKPEFYARLEVEDVGPKDAKSTLVTVSDEKGKLLGEIIAGKRRVDQFGGGNDGIYVRKQGDAQSWLARGTLELPEDPAGWLDRKVVDITEGRVREVVLIEPDGSKLDIVRDKPEDKLALKGAPPNTKLRSDTALAEPAGALAGMELSDVRAAASMPFPGEGVARAEYTTFDGLTIKVALLQQDGKDWARFEASGTGDAAKTAATLNERLEGWVFAIPDYKAKTLKTKLADLTEASKGS